MALLALEYQGNPPQSAVHMGAENPKRSLDELIYGALSSFSLDLEHESKLLSLEKVSVPKFASRWRFLSDHLPIGCSVNGFGLVSWNVLDARYMNYVTELDTQGLNGSLITDLHHQVVGKEEGLTQRDEMIALEIMYMLSMKDYPKHIIALQECSAPFIRELDSQLKESFGDRYKIVTPQGEYPFCSRLSESQSLVLYDSGVFDYCSDLSCPVQYVFGGFPIYKQPMDLMFKEKKTEKIYRVVNAHIPGDPKKFARYDFAKSVLMTDTIKHHEERKRAITIALGDMNFDQDKMDEAFDKEQQDKLLGPSFRRISPYRTNVGPNFDTETQDICAKAIDHFFVSRYDGDGKAVEARALHYKNLYPLQSQINRIEMILKLFLENSIGL